MLELLVASNAGLSCQKFQKADLLGQNLRNCKGIFPKEKWCAFFFSSHEERMREENMRKVRPDFRVRRKTLKSGLTQMTSSTNDADGAR
jgi:hypothetical protein